MSYILQQLIMDVLPRLARTGEPSGLSIPQAANAVVTMINNDLVYRKSDLAATPETSQLVVPIAAQGYFGNLPSNFYAFAEKPRAQELNTDWMMLNVTAYNSTTGLLTGTVTQSQGSDSVSGFNIALPATPSSPSNVVGAYGGTLTVGGQGTQYTNLACSPAMNFGTLPALIWFLPTSIPSNWTPIYHHLDPEYNDDEDDYRERNWWEWYGIYSDTWAPPSIRPRRYKIIQNVLYVWPTITVNVNIVGKYYTIPNALVNPTDVVPWNGMFDEIFREGVVQMVLRGSVNLESDATWTNPQKTGFFDLRIQKVVNPRQRMIPNTQRLKRGTYL